eukprot:TRINITY_DN4602_c0_g1_i1.p1 TRINITY_DN4602_c0_g1~~TRINITY_DN4602_c0_g1_i1.p1  ORF type:complete len:132 (-),score=12.95 TRINITY_DN4602_c0_g1_i1:144-539(-)
MKHHTGFFPRIAANVVSDMGGPRFGCGRVLPPWSNPWLLAAIALSMLLHVLILYVPPLAAMFSVGPLSWAEWKAVICLSFPVIILDEVLKWVSRRTNSGASLKGVGRSSIGLPKAGIKGPDLLPKTSLQKE